MEYKTGLLLALAVQFFGTGDGLDCLEDADCRTKGGQVTGNKVDNVTYCCADPSDYVDMTQVAPGNVTCQCTTTAQAAAAYADRTMSKGHRACHWGPMCERVEGRLRLDGYNLTFCCLGDKQNVHTTHFGGGNVVCRCYGSSLPPVNPHRYVPPQTRNASSSGEHCSYNYDCADNASIQCYSDVATFCCYGSRGLETSNEIETNITRCTCTNDFMGTRCTADPPFPVDSGPNSTEGTTCRSGDECEDMHASFTCSHGNTIFCCLRQGLKLTVVDDVISDCTCVSAGHRCNVTFTSSLGVAFHTAQWWSATNACIPLLVLILWLR